MPTFQAMLVKKMFMLKPQEAVLPLLLHGTTDDTQQTHGHCKLYTIYSKRFCNNLPPLPADGSQQPKHWTENQLPKQVSKVPSTNESREKDQNTFSDPKLEKGTPKNYQKKSKHDSDQVKHTQR